MTEKIRVPDWIAETVAKIPQPSAEELAEAERSERDREQEAEKERQHEDAERRFAATGTPRRVRDLVAAGLAPSKALARVHAWHTEPHRSAWGLILSADKGAGKSVAAGWWLHACGRSASLDRMGKPLRRWWTGPELACLDWYGGAFTDVAEMEGPLVIDDLGVEFNDSKGFFQQRLDALFDARYRDYKPLLITTNLNAHEFQARYGQRAADRLREGGAFYEFREQSMRGKHPLKLVSQA